MLTPPAPNEIEVTLFGPGYGECCVLHIGGGNWIVVDSCIEKESRSPAALWYLSQIGIQPSAVKLVIASHWDDDHVRGLSRVVDCCSTASFVLSDALRGPEFHRMVTRFEQGSSKRSKSGLREIDAIFEILAQRSTPAVVAVSNRRVFSLSGSMSGHGHACTVWTLSPSDADVARSRNDIAQLIPQIGQTKYRFPTLKPNHTSVVLWIEIGTTAILLGGDLEESGQPGMGWSAIIASQNRPTGRASAFKVAHHGSETAHHSGVWRYMLVQDPHAVLAPWSKGAKLPKATDVTRIEGLTKHAFSTSKLRAGKAKTRPPVIEKTLRERNYRLRPLESKMGGVQMRSDLVLDWTVNLLNGACRLTEVHQ